MQYPSLWLQCLYICSCVWWSLLPAQLTAQSGSIEWEPWLQLPPPAGMEVQPGLAGAFSGIHQNALIVAGGANFPQGPSWEGGKKVWWPDVYIWEKGNDSSGQWLVADSFRLPHPLAYGYSFSLPQGVLCVGGNDDRRLYAQSWLLAWNPQSRQLEISQWPALPLPLANMSGALAGNKVYVLGGESEHGPGKHAFFLDVSSADAIAEGWQELPPWPGPARTHAMAAAQDDGYGTKVYVFGGRSARPGAATVFFSDGFAFDPASRKWKAIAHIRHANATSFPLAAGTALPSGTHHILLMGGDDGLLFSQFERWANELEQARQADNDSLVQLILSQRNARLKMHPGFSRKILAYHTLTNTWTEVGSFPSGSPVTTQAHWWKQHIVIPSGEVAPSIRTPAILRGTVRSQHAFGTLNYLLLCLYLLGLVYMGYRFSKKQHSTEDFFKGGRRIPWWAAGLSVFGTQLSAITFMAIPAKTYATDWLYFFLSMTILMVGPFVIWWFLPYYRRMNLTTAYEYLERRFNLATRLIGGLMYIALQLGRLGIVLLLPSLALSLVTGMGVNSCILLMGGLSIAYTVMGGIEAVIWTDVIQVGVLMLGAMLVLIFIPLQLEGGLPAVWETIELHQKMQVLDLRLDFSQPTLWVVLIGGFASNLIQYSSDQTVIQRYLTTATEKEAARSIMTGTLMALPATLIFFSIGTLLFVFYQHQPQALAFNLSSTDAIFPWYIVTQLPQGISGILIAAIFAAAMSSIDSSMNSVATVITTDFVRRFRKGISEQTYLKLARALTVGVGLTGTALALYMAQGGSTSLWDDFNTIVGLFAGGLGGIFLLGILSKRANGPGAVAGLLVSGGAQYLISEFTQVHFLLYACTGLLTAWGVGYLASLLFRRRRE